MNPTERIIALTGGGTFLFPIIPYVLGLQESTFFLFAIIGAIFGFTLALFREGIIKY